MGGWWRLAVVGSCWLVAAGGWRRLVVGGWWLAGGGPLGRSLRAVLSKKKKIWFLKDRPGGGGGIGSSDRGRFPMVGGLARDPILPHAYLKGGCVSVGTGV